jgi:hypothetical protein
MALYAFLNSVFFSDQPSALSLHFSKSIHNANHSLIPSFPHSLILEISLFCPPELAVHSLSILTERTCTRSTGLSELIIDSGFLEPLTAALCQSHIVIASCISSVLLNLTRDSSAAALPPFLPRPVLIDRIQFYFLNDTAFSGESDRSAFPRKRIRSFQRASRLDRRSKRSSAVPVLRELIRG